MGEGVYTEFPSPTKASPLKTLEMSCWARVLHGVTIALWWLPEPWDGAETGPVALALTMDKK